MHEIAEYVCPMHKVPITLPQLFKKRNIGSASESCNPCFLNIKHLREANKLNRFHEWWTWKRKERNNAVKIAERYFECSGDFCSVEFFSSPSVDFNSLVRFMICQYEIYLLETKRKGSRENRWYMHINSSDIGPGRSRIWNPSRKCKPANWHFTFFYSLSNNVTVLITLYCTVLYCIVIYERTLQVKRSSSRVRKWCLTETLNPDS